ncbi:MAG: hypothetical protein WBC04_06740 [Candidatus Acidiferrales bacterium]
MRKTRQAVFTVVILAASLLALSATLAQPTSAGSLSTAVIGMFPKDTGEFAYADLKAARQYPWFPQLRDQLLPNRFRQFEQFLNSAGIDPNTQVEELSWGAVVDKSGGEQIVGVALGQFSPQSAEDRFKQQKLPFIENHGYHLYAFGSGSGPSDILFFFLDSNTAAFGHRAALEKLIDVRFGGSESLMRNDKMFPLINEANGNGLVWAVLDQRYTHLAMEQLLPQASQFPQAATIIDRLHAMVINIQANGGVDASFQAVCNSPDDANLLAAALQAGVMYRRYQEAQANPDLARALDGVRVSPSGERLKVEIPVSQEQLGALLRNRTFAVPM